MPRKMKRRPVIGVIPGWMAYEGTTSDRYLNTLFWGIQSQAALRGCNLLLAWAGLLRIRAPWSIARLDRRLASNWPMSSNINTSNINT